MFAMNAQNMPILKSFYSRTFHDPKTLKYSNLVALNRFQALVLLCLYEAI